MDTPSGARTRLITPKLSPHRGRHQPRQSSKAFQLLAQDESKIEDVKETVCWKRLHLAMPGLFLSPETLFLRLTPVKTSPRPQQRT